MNPELEAAAERELHSEDFVFTEDEKEQNNCYPEKGDGPVIQIVQGRHGRSMTSC
jgi:hypothetical protein